MNYLIRILILSLLIVGTGINHAQIPNNTWRDHLPYSNVKRLTEVNQKIFCATTGGMFSYSKPDMHLQPYSKVSGLADVNISTIGYSGSTQTLVVCYENGNIDLIANDSITNLPDIMRKLITGDKIINHILFINEYAYLACGFGIVAIDLRKKEIKDSYFFGPLGSQIYVNDIAYDGEHLIAGTKQGIFKASLNSPNLVDYNYWERISVVPDMEADYKSIVYFSGKLLTVYQNPVTSRSDIIEISTNNWSVWSPEQLNYRMLELQQGHMTVITDNSVQVFDDSFSIIQTAWKYNPQFTLFDSDGIIWIADSNDGLIRSVNGNLSDGLFPNGPRYPDVGELVYQDGYLWAGAGNQGNVYKYLGGYLFKDEQWSNINRETIPDLENYPNISDIAVDPSDPAHIFGGHTGYGVIEIQGNTASIYDETNSVLKPIEGFGHGYIFITGMSFDRNNDLWISTNYDENPVYVRRHDGTWENIKLQYDGFGFNTRVSDIFATSYGQIWLLLERNGILVFRENLDGSFSEKFFTVINQRGDLLDRVYSVAEDNDGNIWIGTIAGPVIYYSPYGIIEEEDDITGTQMLIPRNDGSGLGDLLLKNEKINCIAIDGANRKWFATEKSGVFLMSEDGKTEIHKFNSENSPLFSDNVRSIAINDDNGEVFFGTDRGILSFMGQATEGGEEYRDVYVYPNPVREYYRGDITITGLVANVNVKITDVSGNIVYETQALGGQAIWDGNNFRGERVGTGVYLIFCSNDDGTKTHVTKLLFIH